MGGLLGGGGGGKRYVAPLSNYWGLPPSQIIGGCPPLPTPMMLCFVSRRHLHICKSHNIKFVSYNSSFEYL